MNRSVKFLRWPAEERIRSRYKREGTPCLLIVDPGASPPVCGDLSEDWIRSPASRQDVEARVETMLRRIDVHQIPVIDAAGLVHFNNKSVNISKTQTELMKRLVAHFGDVVYRDELEQDLAKCAQAPTRNSLDLHMMRLRRRISALNLCVRTVWGRGYVLEPQPN